MSYGSSPRLLFSPVTFCILLSPLFPFPDVQVAALFHLAHLDSVALQGAGKDGAGEGIGGVGRVRGHSYFLPRLARRMYSEEADGQ